MENVHKILKLDLKLRQKRGEKFMNSLKVYKGVARLIYKDESIDRE